MEKTPYSTHKGKTYLKAVIVAQANTRIADGDALILPVGTTFEPTTEEELYLVTKHLPFPERFLVRRFDGEGEAIHAMASVVKRVVSVSDDCPPVAEWLPASGTPPVPLPHPWK